MLPAPIAEEVTQFIADEFLDGDDEDLEVTSPLLEWGILDSVGMVKLVSHLEDRYGIRIPQSEITPSNFRDVTRISSMVVAHSSRPPAIDAEAGMEADPDLAELIEFGATIDLVRLDSGAKLHTTVVEGDGPTWILLPEPGEAATFYADVQRALEGHFRSVAVDLLGFGLSQGASEEPTFWDQVGLLAELLRRDRARSYVLVGHGLSAALALELARRVPEQTLATIGLAFGALDDVAGLLDQASDTEAFLAQRRRDPQTTPAWQVEATAARLRSPAFGAFVDAELRGALTTLFEQAMAPALFVGGTEDLLVPMGAVERAGARTPSSEIKWLSRAGHAFARERPDETVSLMKSYIERLI